MKYLLLNAADRIPAKEGVHGRRQEEQGSREQETLENEGGGSDEKSNVR